MHKESFFLKKGGHNIIYYSIVLVVACVDDSSRPPPPPVRNMYSGAALFTLSGPVFLLEQSFFPSTFFTSPFFFWSSFFYETRMYWLGNSNYYCLVKPLFYMGYCEGGTQQLRQRGTSSKDFFLFLPSSNI